MDTERIMTEDCAKEDEVDEKEDLVGEEDDMSISNESPNSNSTANSRPHSDAHIVVMSSLPGPPSTPPPPATKEEEQQAKRRRHKMDPYFRESLFNILSGLYAMLLIVIGIAIPLAEIFSAGRQSAHFEGFYLYLYGVSVLFLIYVYIVLLSRRGQPSRRAANGETEYLRNEHHKKKVSQMAGEHTGSFYLRLGAVAFGIGAMIHEGLMFGQLFEYESWSCVKATQAARPIIQLIFTFVQLYFIFLNSKMSIHRYRVLAQFGLMHMVATNICVWLRTVVEETVHDIEVNTGIAVLHKYLKTNESVGGHHVSAHVHYNSNGVDVDGANLSSYILDPHSEGEIPCLKEDIMAQVVKSASPYLYPCVIEYSLIAAGILYVMWHNITRQVPGGLDGLGSNSSLAKKKHRVSVDCSGANRGLFFGIFTLVAAIISMIVFYVLMEREEYKIQAILIEHISEIVLYLLATIACIVAWIRIRDMKFLSHRDNLLDEVLLLVALVGQYLFCLFSIIAGSRALRQYVGLLTMITSLLILLQSTLQTVFIFNGLRRVSFKAHHERKKPGREFITFLLVSNIAMWAFNTFEVLRSDAHPIAIEFYGFLPWSIITHISIPLSIFYRFHSTVCLAHIWKNAYKLKNV